MDKADLPLKAVVKGALIFFVGMLFAKFFNYLFRLVTARLGTETYGLITLSLSFVSVLSVVATLGLNNGVLRYVPFYNSKGDSRKVKGVILYSLKVSLLVGSVIGLLLFVFSGFISRNFFPNVNQSVFPDVLRIISLSLPLMAVLFIFYASFEAFRLLKYEIYAKNIFDGAFKIAFALLAIYLGYGIFGVAFVYVASVLGSVVISLYYLNRYVFPLFKHRSDADYINRELLFYSMPLVFSGLCIILITSVDSWIIGYFKTASDVGLYNAAMPTAQLLYTIPSMLLILFLPVLSELYSKDEKGMFRTVYRSVTKWIFLVNLPLLAVLVLFPKQVLGFLFGSQYVPASFALMVLSFGFFVNSFVMTSERMLMVIKRTRYILFSYVAVLVLNTVLNLYLVPSYGINGAAFASAISYFVLTLFFVVGSYMFSKVLPFNFDYVKSLFAVVVSSTIVYLISSGYSYGFYFFVFLIGLFMLLYISLLFVLRAFDRDDIMILKSIKDKVFSTISRI